MDTERKIITQLTRKNVEGIIQLLPKEKRILIIKFTADWCGPCRRIKKDCYSMFNQLPENVVVADLNVDLEHNSEIYSFMKRKRMVNGIPVLMAWYPLNDRAFWYVPDDSITGGDINEIGKFLNRVCQKSVSI